MNLTFCRGQNLGEEAYSLYELLFLTTLNVSTNRIVIRGLLITFFNPC